MTTISRTKKPKKSDLIKDETHIKNKTLLVDQDKFKKTVNYVLETFKNRELTKIVLSQAVDVSSDESQNLAFYLDALLDKNPTAYNFVIPVDNQQYLRGAIVQSYYYLKMIDSLRAIL